MVRREKKIDIFLPPVLPVGVVEEQGPNIGREYRRDGFVVFRTFCREKAAKKEIQDCRLQRRVNAYSRQLPKIDRSKQALVKGKSRDTVVSSSNSKGYMSWGEGSRVRRRDKGETSEDAGVLERVVQDRLLDGREHEADVGGIGGLCQTAVEVSIKRS